MNSEEKFHINGEYLSPTNLQIYHRSINLYYFLYRFYSFYRQAVTMREGTAGTNVSGLETCGASRKYL